MPHSAKDMTRQKHKAPRVVPRPEHDVSRNNISREALKVLYRLKECGCRAYLAGGGVRDLLLGRKPKDFDIVTDATPNHVRKLFRNCRLIGRRFRLAHVYFNGNKDIIEVATFRAGSAPDTSSPAGASGVGAARDAKTHPSQRGNRSGARPGKRAPISREDGLIVRDNVYGTPEEDALRRDFTVNALFYNIDGFTIVDYVNGLADLKQKTIRAIGDPGVRYIEDPIRMIRAIRFASSLGFRIERKAERAIKTHREHITEASNARLYEEILKVFRCGAASEAYEHLDSSGLFKVMFPKLSDWLSRDGGRRAKKRIRQAFAQIDEWVKAGKEVGAEMLLVLVLGEYYEAEAIRLQEEGAIPWQAAHVAVLEHLADLSQRMMVPKTVRHEIAAIMAVQPRLTRTTGKQVQRLVARRYFPHALEYFRFVSDLTGENQELINFWAKESAGVKRQAPHARKPRRGRRPRRRGPVRNKRQTARLNQAGRA